MDLSPELDRMVSQRSRRHNHGQIRPRPQSWKTSTSTRSFSTHSTRPRSGSHFLVKINMNNSDMLLTRKVRAFYPSPTSAQTLQTCYSINPLRLTTNLGTFTGSAATGLGSISGLGTLIMAGALSSFGPVSERLKVSERLETIKRLNLAKYSSTFSNNLTCGFVSGMVVTGLLNPWDRALYLSLTNNRHFLNIKNFRSPYQGISQTLVQRSLSTGLYFPLEDFFISLFNSNSVASGRLKNDNFRNVLAGNIAGIINGLVLNPLSYVKYQCWGRNNYSFFSQAKQLYSSGGLFVFLRGARATCARDAVFGATYSLLRNLDLDAKSKISLEKKRTSLGRKNKPFVQDLCSAAVGTIFSSPLNYFRNIQYHEHSHRSCPTMRQIYRNLLVEVHIQDSAMSKLKLVQHRLRIGWGTLRVAVGMALGSKLYSMCHSDIEVER